MRFPCMRHVAFSAALATSLVALAAPALASEPLEVKAGETVYLTGTVQYRSITVRAGGTLAVRALTAGVGGTGTLRLKAESVLVEKDGVIDARGAGYDGTTGAGSAPSCCTSAGGLAGPAAAGATPGGGAGSGGNGAPGCPNGGTGGIKYEFPANGNPGAAGGAAFFPNAAADVPNHGGRGGGAIYIEAATVTIEGTVTADGAAGLSYGGVGTGGGAGGFISIDAFELSGSGLLSAKGGLGGAGFSGIGGGGGGGVIQILAAKPLPDDGMGNALLGVDVNGATTGTCTGADPGKADVTVDIAKPCTDADGDGEGAMSCGGEDCDDSDPAVHGGAKPAVEICDGQDNDCNGSIDDDLVKDACAEDQTCASGECVDDGSSSSSSGGGAAAPPDYLDYRGACAMGTSRGANGAGALAGALLGLAAALGARRRKR